MQFRQTDGVAVAAAKTSISIATGYRLAGDPRLPSIKKGPRGRRRADPLGDLFEAEVVPLLMSAPGLRPIAIFEEIVRRHADLGTGIRRTLERRIRSWRAVHGEDQEVIFRQTHEPGRTGMSDFTIAAQSGLGYTAMQAREFMQTDVVVMAIVIYALLGKLADGVATLAERRAMPWRERAR